MSELLSVLIVGGGLKGETGIVSWANGQVGI